MTAANDWSTLSMAALVRRLARQVPRRPAFRDADGRVVSYAELDQRSDRLARAFVAAGIAPGDHVAALTLNSVPMMELFMAAAKARAVILPLNWRLAPPELAYIFGDAVPKLLFASAGLADLAAGIDTDVPTILIHEKPDGCPYEAFLAQGGDETALPEVVPDDIWIMLYTSGTTGRPKGCRLDQKGQVISAFATRGVWQAGPFDRLAMALPLFHVGGLGILLGHFAAGAETVMAPRHFGPVQALDFLAEHRCTTAGLPPQYYTDMVAAQKQAPRALVLRTTTMGGGMHLPAEVSAVRDTLGVEPLLGYGQTEAGNFIAYLTASEQLERPAACGRPLAHLDWRIVDDAGQSLPAGATGELCVRGTSVMAGYWNQPDASAATLKDGWLHTGDLCAVDNDGYLTLVGRKKELIKSGGENVYPREVEAVLMAHPAIAECAVFGVPHPRWGEGVKAVIVVKADATLDKASVTAWCRDRIAGYKRPRLIEFLPTLPRSEAGKLSMRELKERPVTADQATD